MFVNTNPKFTPYMYGPAQGEALKGLNTLPDESQRELIRNRVKRNGPIVLQTSTKEVTAFYTNLDKTKIYAAPMFVEKDYPHLVKLTRAQHQKLRAVYAKNPEFIRTGEIPIPYEKHSHSAKVQSLDKRNEYMNLVRELPQRKSKDDANVEILDKMIGEYLRCPNTSKLTEMKLIYNVILATTDMKSLNVVGLVYFLIGAVAVIVGLCLFLFHCGHPSDRWVGPTIAGSVGLGSAGIGGLLCGIGACISKAMQLRKLRNAIQLIEEVNDELALFGTENDLYQPALVDTTCINPLCYSDACLDSLCKDMGVIELLYDFAEPAVQHYGATVEGVQKTL